MVRWALRLRLEKSLVASHDVERCTSILSMHTQNRARVKRGQCLLALATFLGCEVHLKKFSAQLAKFHSSFSRLFFFSSLVCSTCVRLDNYLFVWRSVMNSQWKRRLYIFFVCFIHSSPRFRVALSLLGYQVQSAKKRRKIGETNAIWNSDWLNGRRRFHSCFLLLCFFSGSCAGCGQKKSGAGRSAAARKRARRPPQRAISSAWSRTDG